MYRSLPAQPGCAELSLPSSPAAGRAAPWHAGAVFEPLRAAWQRLRDWNDRRLAIGELRRIGAGRLADIGLDRAAAGEVVDALMARRRRG